MKFTPPSSPLHPLHAALTSRGRRALCALALLTVALTAGVAALALLSSGPVQAQGAEPPPPSNLQCTTRTDAVWFMWDVPEWAGEEAVSYDYELSLPDGRREQGNVKGQTLLRRGSYPSGKPVSLSVKANYETAEGGRVSSAQATLTCYIGGARVLAIKAGNTTRKYGGTDALSHTVSGLVDGDAASNVVSGSLGRAPGDDAGSYAINLGTLAIAPAYATKYALPADFTAATAYTITPRAVTWTGTAPARAYDGTATLVGALSGSFAAGDIVNGDVVTVSGGSYAAADAGTGIAVTGVSVGGADAGNYDVTFSVSGAITPLEITTISGVRVNSRVADGTTDATFDTGRVRVIGALAGELADLRAGGLVVSGQFPSAEAGSHDLSVTYSLQDHGAFKAGNYTLSPSVVSATLHGEIRDASSPGTALGPQPAPRLEPAPTPTPTPAPTPQPTQAADDATLKALAISAGSLDFAPGTTAYAVDVAATVGRVTLTPAANHPHAAVTVNGGDPAGPVSLDYGANVISVAVTAVDGVATETYVVTVTRPRSENVRFTAVVDLAAPGNRDLALTGLATPEGITVHPEFRRNHYSYRLVAPGDLTELVVIGRFTTPYRYGSGNTAYVLVSEDLAQAEIDWDNREPEDWPRDLVSILHRNDNPRPQTITLEQGAATTAQVGIYKWKSRSVKSGFAENTYKQVYTLTVTRGLPADNDATLHDLTVSEGTLDFDPDNTAYTVDVPYTTESVVFTAVPFHPNAAVAVNGGDPASPVALDYNASNPVNVVVTAPDGVATQTYAVTVNRTFPTRPNPSGDLRLTVQADSITVTWRGPGSGDLPDYYVARLENADGDATEQRLGADARTATFESLESGATYTVSVRSGNDGGVSDWSQAVTVVTGADSFAGGCQPEAGDDYDDDDDGLIEVCSLAQLDAIRFDLDGDGSASGSAIADANDKYEGAFPGITANGAGCPQSGCKGYELAANLDFDRNGNGRADAGDYPRAVDGGHVNDGQGWLPIGEYAAVFDGNGHAISYLYISRDDRYQALFRELGETGVIRNVALENAQVRGSGKGIYVSALVGKNRGAISNASVTGSVSDGRVTGLLVGQNRGAITDSHSSGEVWSTNSFVGGLVGSNYGGRIVRSYSTADVTAVASGTDYYGGLVGYSTTRRIGWDSAPIRASIVASYATGRVSGNANFMGGLVGDNAGEIFASYATGDVSGRRYIGGLVGDNGAPISASYALGAVSGDGYVGGLAGNHRSVSTKNGHRCIGCTLPNVRPGHADRSNITASYWLNSRAAGQAGRRLTTAELRRPTGYTGIYALWDDLRDRSGDSHVWDFGTSLDFPVLRDTGPSVAAQRAAMPDPPESTEPVTRPSNQQPAQGIDYDRDDDGLIEVHSLDQLYAIRYDEDGRGAYGWDHNPYPNSARNAYQSAYPNARRGMGCPGDGCMGYELMADLDFDTNGNGRADPGDHYWNGSHNPDGSARCRSWYGGHPGGAQGPGACDDYFGNDGEGWRPIAQDIEGGNYWRGIFEGNGHAIRNLYINTLDTPFTDEVLNRVNIYGLPTDAGDGKHDDKGLFYIIAYNGIVRNLRLENVNVSGKGYIGALAGYSHGIISNVHVTGAVSGISNVGGLVGEARSGSFITGSSSRANVAGRKVGGQGVGGLAGANQGLIQASYARGAVSGWADNTGGLVGRNAAGGSIKTSYATGPVSSAGQRAGGLVGDNNGSVTASYATGSATAEGGAAGGLTGAHVSGAVDAAYWDTQTSGLSSSPAGVGQTTAGLQGPTGYAGIYADWNADLDLDGSGDDPWDFGTASQYPVLQHGGLSPAAQRAPFTAVPLNLPQVVDAAPAAPNQAPTATGSLDDVTVAARGGIKDVSLSGLFDDADGDSLTVTAHTLTITAEPPPGHDGSSYIQVVTAAVSSDQSTLTLTGLIPGVARVTVTANDGKGGTALVDFAATVSEEAPQAQEPGPDTSGDYSELIARMYQWRNDPQWVSYQAHTDRWDRALLAFGETVSDTTLTAMTASEAQGYADTAWGTRWVDVAAALKEIEAAAEPDPQQQQGTPNQAPTVSAALGDAIIVNESGTKRVSLSGTFSDGDGDSLTVTATSSDETKATMSVASDHSTLTVTAQARGTATITVTADDGNGGTVEDTFTVTVKAAPVVAAAISDVSGLEVGATQEVSLSGAFRDADGDALTITAASSDETIATVSVASDGSKLTVARVAEGAATITVTAQDADGNRVSDAFDVSVAKQYAALIAKMYQWRNDPQWSSYKAHTDRWDRALLALGETVSDASLTPMTAAEAQDFADRGWSRWVEVAAALKEIEAAPQQQQATPNQSPTVAAAIADAAIVNQSGTRTVSISGVFSDADNDDLTITAASSDETKATVSVAADYSGLTVSAQARGTATITVTADDGNGGTVSDAFTVKVKAAPVVAAAIGDVSGLEVGDGKDVSLSSVFRDADGDSLTFSAASSDDAVVDAFLFHGTLTVAGVSEGSGTITVTAEDADGNRISDEFEVSVVPEPEQPNRAPTVASAIDDVTIVNQSGAHQVSLSGVFDDADNDALTITAGSSTDAVATVSVSADYSGLTVSAQSRGTATITVTANDDEGGTVSDEFTVRVKSAPVVAQPLADVSGLEAGSSQDVSLSGVFRDADGDNLTITASSSDDAKATVTVVADQSKITLAGVAEGTSTITVTAQDSDGNRVSDSFDVSVEAEPEEEDPGREASDGSPTVVSPLADISLELPGHREISLSGVFHDPDGDDLTFSATSSNYAVAATLHVNGSTLTVVGTGTGTATITVTAEDPDGNQVSDAFQVTVTPAS